MDRNSFISGFKTLPWCCISAVVIFLGINFALSGAKPFWRFCYLYSDPYIDDSIRLGAKFALIDKNSKKDKIFIIGASQAREDFDVDEINREIEPYNMEVFNLGISAGQPIDMVMLKDKFLSYKPKAFIYVTYLGDFYTKFKYTKMKYYFNPAILPYFAKNMGYRVFVENFPHFVDSFLSMPSVIYKYREPLKRIIDTRIKYFLKKETRAAPLQFKYDRSLSKLYFMREILLYRQTQKSYFDEAPATGFNMLMFDKFIGEMIGSGQDMTVLKAPTHPLFKLTYNPVHNAPFEGFLKEEHSKYGYDYLDFDAMKIFNQEDFIDFVHLNVDGRAKLTRIVKKVLETKRS